jgi:hypothetical protein
MTSNLQVADSPAQQVGVVTTPSSSETRKRKTPTGKLYAIADIHVAFAFNREAWSKLAPHPGDGLILCGDVGETIEHLHLAFSKATKCFDTVWWCPGNHELYTLSAGSNDGARGELKYQQCVEVARSYDVLTPEDDFVVWEGEGGPAVIAPIFTLYDYSFKPDDVALESTSNFAYNSKSFKKGALSELSGLRLRALRKCIAAPRLSGLVDSKY